MNFICVIFHLFFKVVQVLSHGTHCSGHNIYSFGNIIDWLFYSPSGLSLLVYYPDEATSIDIPFWRTAGKALNVDSQPIIVVKTFNDLIFPFSKGLYLNSCFLNNGNNFLVEGMMGWILALTRRFIPNNAKKCFVKPQNRSIKNPLQICVMRDPCFFGQTYNRQTTSHYQVLFVYHQGLEGHPDKSHLKPWRTSGQESFHISCH